MTTSDDPPFLNVGTEVSAKYRGAFCEATIKIAKKLVKCKVSYTKGQTDTVPNDLIKGPLKVGANVEVRQQSDGQYLPGLIQKLTDASTYTVVFDDGDERTLKRSSLCLKGGRHYSASESLDQMPLTDPENFGTPAHFQSKRGTRRKRHNSQSSSPEAEAQSPLKKPATSSYPPAYPVGKCVFLENDRRRACWVPGVIVPAHYVMDESEMTPDTICIRSFKDGRFFAAKTSELHDFAPDKEPLSSMLEGDIQPMYLCKPAIERAMAYLDTKELPWNMDLFENRDGSPSRGGGGVGGGVEGETNDHQLTDEQKKDMEDFYRRLAKFHQDKGTSLNLKPLLAQRDLNLYKLYNLVKDKGGMEKVTQELKWRSLYLQMGMPPLANSSYIIKQAYKKHLYSFEMYEKAGKPLTIKNKRRSTVHKSGDDTDKPTKPAIVTVQNATRQKSEGNRLGMTSPLPPPPSITPSTTPRSEGGTTVHEAKVNGTGSTPRPVGSEYKVNDRVNIWYGKGKTQRTYEAKIIDSEEINPGKMLYYVHYNGWNTRYDEWVETSRLAGKATGSAGKHAGRASYSKKKHGRLKSQQNGSKQASDDERRSSVGTIASPSSIPISETPSSYSSGSESGSVKTPKSTGSGKRRRMSSATTETSSSNSDNPQSPDSVALSYLSMHSSLTTPSLTSSAKHHPLTKQYPLSPPISSSPPRVPPILSPDGSHNSLSLRAQPEDCEDSETTSQDGQQQVDIKREESLDWIQEEEGLGSVQSEETKSSENEEEPVPMCHLNETPPSPLLSPGRIPNSTPSPPPPCPEVKVETDEEQQQQLDAAYSLMQVTTTVISPCPSLLISSTPTVSCSISTETTNSSSPPPVATQSENSSSSISSSTESEHELSLLLEPKQSPSISPVAQKSQGNSPRKRKGGGHDSGVDNGSESDGRDSKRIADRDDLDFSIDMTDLDDLTTSERIGMILDRMKDIQKRYMELKAEVTYLDRKRRRARRREREAARLQAVSPANSSSLQSMPHPHFTATPPPSLPASNLQQQQPLLTEAELSHKLPMANT